MYRCLSEELARLKFGLLALPAVGPLGFEGLLAVILSAITGQPFRLASSGSQGGRDGNSATDGGAVYFEAKRYADSVPRNTISDKLLELQISSNSAIDLYIVASTSEISAQHAAFYDLVCSRIGIDLLVLDWSETAIPELALLLALAPEPAEQFLSSQLGIDGQAAAFAIRAVSSEPTALDLLATLRRKIADPALSLLALKQANRRWFNNTFSNHTRACQYFGQPLAPMAPAAMVYRPRPTLRLQLEAAFKGPPTGAVYLVSGDEGVGKSWLVASTWLEVEPAPLLAFFSADEFAGLSGLSDLDIFLARKLVSQCDASAVRDPQERWLRRLRHWRQQPAVEQVRLAVVVDGINQVPGVPWVRWIDALALYLGERGCRLIVTTRPVFASTVLTSLSCEVIRVTAAPWSGDELSEILGTKAIDVTSLSPDVCNALRNPRLLGIALSLLEVEKIRCLRELSVERLLFEHMRQSNRSGAIRIAPDVFARTLQSLAKEMVARMARKENDDLRIFEAGVDGGIAAAAETRFFSAVAGEPDRYAISKEGLPLALGLWLISEILAEIRNGRAPLARLEVVLEPIQALDLTAEVVLAALLAASLNEQIPEEVGVTLLGRYITLQNRPANSDFVLVGLARRATKVFLTAARAQLIRGYDAQRGVLGDALRQARELPDAWAAIAVAVRKWLTTRSLKAGKLHSQMTASERAEESVRHISALGARTAALSQEEASIVGLAGASEAEEDLSTLHRFAFDLLVGRPLAEFASELVNWALGTSLNPAIGDPHDEFSLLIRHNSTDWKETREALLSRVQPLRTEGVTKVGQWALHSVLLATGNTDDAFDAHTLCIDLMKDREQFTGWRLVEQYCASDPCDPTSTIPANVFETAEKFSAVAVDTLKTTMGQTETDMFVDHAGLGVARFWGPVAISKYRDFGLQITQRTGLPLRQGVLALMEHSAVLQNATVDGLVKIALACTKNDQTCLNGAQDPTLILDRALRAALPHMDGEAQFEVVSKIDSSMFSHELVTLFRPVSANRMLTVLKQTLDPHTEVAVRNAVCFMYFSNSPIAEQAFPLVRRLLTSEDRLIRAFALGIASRTENEELIRAVATGGWTAKGLDPQRHALEIWLGSRVIGMACKRGFVAVPDALERMIFSHYGIVTGAGPDALNAVAARVNVAVQHVMGLDDIPILPDMESKLPVASGTVPPSVRIRTLTSSVRRFVSGRSRSDEGGEHDWEHAQTRAWRRYAELNKQLTREDARLALDHLPQDLIDQLMVSHPSLVESWTQMFIEASDSQKSSLGYFGLQIASALAYGGKDHAQLQDALKTVRPIISVVSSSALTSAGVLLLWRNAAVAEIRTICWNRLDQARNDAEIAQEVLTASEAGQEDVLYSYIDIQLESALPTRQCRALMVAGYMQNSRRMEQVFNQFAHIDSFVGDASAAARYAYERNEWARHWLQKMLSVGTEEEFWRASRMYIKIVDSRSLLWISEQSNGNAIFRAYFPTISDAVRDRLQRVQRTRQKTLFGGKIPWWL
jgi:hypothetical protein